VAPADEQAEHHPPSLRVQTPAKGYMEYHKTSRNQQRATWSTTKPAETSKGLHGVPQNQQKPVLSLAASVSLLAAQLLSSFW